MFLKNRHFIIQERFNKLIYGIKNKIIFYHISDLMLPTLIQRYDNKSFHFWSTSKTRLTEIYRLSGAIFYDCITTIYQFIKPFLDNKMSIFEEYGASSMDGIMFRHISG